MKSDATFRHGVLFAFLAAMAGGVFQTVLASSLPEGERHALLCALLGLAYLFHLFGRLPCKPGRLVVLGLGVSFIVLGLITPLPLAYQLLLQTALIWGTRTTLLHENTGQAVADLCLQGFAIAAMVIVYSRTGSAALSVWSFFLIQALFVFFVDTDRREHGRLKPEARKEIRFSRARWLAENAIERLSSNI